MKVSIITPMYNAQQYIEKTIKSVISQTYKDWEMIIVDDVSCDDSVEIVKNYMSEDNRIVLIELQDNKGPANARNIAIKNAKGKYIAFLDSDDIWYENKLKKQITFMQERKLHLTYSAYDTMDQETNYINTRYIISPINYKSMLKSNHIGNLTGIYDIDFFGKHYFKKIGHEDYVYWLELIKNIDYTEGINEPLASYRVLENSISANKLTAMKWQWYIYRKVENLNIIQSIYNFVFYIYYALKKRS